MCKIQARVGAAIAVAASATCGYAQTVSHLSGTGINFNGPATFAVGSPTVVTTAEYTPNPSNTIVAPNFIYPTELYPLTATDTDDGFYLSGRCDFLDGSGSSVQVSIIAERPVSLTTQSYGTASELSSAFGIDSADFVSPINGPIEPVDASLVTFTVSTYLVGDSETFATATGQGPPGDVPVDATFPTGAFYSTGAETFGDGTAPISGSYELVQDVTIDFSGLIPGESVDIDLPEPTAALPLISLGALLLLRRSRHLRIPV